jgi:hypothetical protein
MHGSLLCKRFQTGATLGRMRSSRQVWSVESSFIYIYLRGNFPFLLDERQTEINAQESLPRPNNQRAGRAPFRDLKARRVVWTEMCTRFEIVRVEKHASFVVFIPSSRQFNP